MTAAKATAAAMAAVTTAFATDDPARMSAVRHALVAWFTRAGRDLPWRRTHDPYAILVSEFMLQQTQVATVVPYYERWLHRFPDAAALARAPEADVLRAWEGLGYYARARNLHRAARVLVEEHGGEFPRALGAIAALPGVGRYTAGAVVSFAFDLPVAAVDANVARVLARWLNLSTPLDTAAGQAAVWTTAERFVPAPGQDQGDGVNPRRWNSALMELGALVCRARAPACLICPAQGWCGAFASGAPEAVPVKAARRATVAVDEPCAWIVSPERGLLLQQSTAGARWRGLWKLPPLSFSPAPTGDEGKEPPLFQTVYPFTHHRVTLRVFAAPAPAGELAPGQRWWPLTEVEDAAMAAPHRRAVRALLSGPKDK